MKRWWNTPKHPASARRLFVLASVLLAAAAVVVVPAVTVRAQQSEAEFKVDGIQANSSSPFVVSGDYIGAGTVWKHMIGPVLSTTAFAMIPSAPGFGGAGCYAEYSQDQIVAQEGSTITVDVYGTRCEPYGSSGAHNTFGVYSILGGTGQFQVVNAGCGTITINVRADGSANLRIDGGIIRAR